MITLFLEGLYPELMNPSMFKRSHILMYKLGTPHLNVSHISFLIGQVVKRERDLSTW